MRRSLSLRKETLPELATEELGSVVGGSQGDTCVTYSVVLTGCQCSGIYPSLNVRCPVTEVTDAFAVTGACK